MSKLEEIVGDSEAPHGKLRDYISGEVLQAKPEEMYAVQPFARQLVEDYGYPRADVRTRPQWHVKASPSDKSKSYPVDIAVFRGDAHRDEGLYIVVECKAPDRQDGLTQLQDYMRLSRAELGVWFNGHERLFLRKVEGRGKVQFEEIPNIPKYGQRVEDIGHFARRDLAPTHNLKAVFRSVRNYLAANAVGMTRDEALAQQIINLIFCKIYDERFTKRDATVSMRAGINEQHRDIAARVKSIFANVVKSYSDVFSAADKISLDDRSIAYVVGELQQYSLMECARDVVGDAFETFIGPSLKGSQGQFFTPRNVTSLVRALVSPVGGDMILDPACGSGGFLVEALRGLWKAIDETADEYDWPEHERESEKQKVAIRQIRGIDKDEFLTKVAKAYMALLGDGRGGVFCENSLERFAAWKPSARQEVTAGEFDVIMTNPPFGQKLKISEKSILSQYELGHRWARRSGQFVAAGSLLESQTPQILFIERCLELLKPGGRLGIVLPESMLCSPTHRYILQFVLTKADVRAVVSMPEALFEPNTHAKTAVILLEKREPGVESKPHEIFMALAKWCGHDSRGHEIPFDDVPAIVERWNRFLAGEILGFDHLGFTISSSDIRDMIFLPRYYDPEVPIALEALSQTHDLVTLGSLEEDGIIEVATGDEVGKLAYGTGSVPFIRTSDIANWQIKADPKHGLSEALYEEFSARQHVEPGDILMVKDGTYLVGTCAIVTNLDYRIVYQSHLLKLKVRKPEIVSPFLLLAVLSSPIVKRQIYAKRFTQDIIDSLGGRWRELVLPIPRDPSAAQQITETVQTAIDLRARAAQLSYQAVRSVVPTVPHEGDSDDELTYDFGVLNR